MDSATKSMRTSEVFMDKRNWDSIQGLNMNDQEGSNENLNDFEPSENSSVS